MKNNLAYSLVRDTFSVLGNSKCEVLSALDPKIHFIHCGFQRIQKGIVEYYHILGVPYIYIKNAYGIEHLSFNLALIYKYNLRVLTKHKALQSNYGQFTIIYTLKKSHTAKLENFLKALLKNGLKISPKVSIT